MTKHIQELALSFLLIVTGMTLILGLIWVKPVLDSQKLFLDESRRNQEQVMAAVEETRILVTEIVYISAVLGMTENKVIQPVEANKMIDESIKKIGEHSDRFGRLAQAMNDYRINQQAR